MDKPANILVIPCLIGEKFLIKDIFSIFQVVCKRCHNSDVMHKLAVTVLYMLSFKCPPTILFKVGIFSSKIRWVRKNKSYLPHLIRNAMALRFNAVVELLTNLKRMSKIMLMFIDSRILVKVTCCCPRTNCTYVFGEQAFYQSKNWT